jgi:hypothetical protein
MCCCALGLVAVAAAGVQALEPVPCALCIDRPDAGQPLKALQQDALGPQLEGRQLPA